MVAVRASGTHAPLLLLLTHFQHVVSEARRAVRAQPWCLLSRHTMVEGRRGKDKAESPSSLPYYPTPFPISQNLTTEPRQSLLPSCPK